MAKVTFSKLGLSKNTEVKEIEWNDQKIEVKQYLPIEEKIDLVGKVLNESVDDNGYYNPIRLNIYTNMEIIMAYTNISFTEKQKEDILKLYDLFYGCELVDKIFETIPEDEISDITDWTYEAIDNIYNYRNSAAGIMEAIGRDYSDLELDADKIKGDIANPENLTLLKDVLTKLG